jgi:hypothetical protein
MVPGQIENFIQFCTDGRVRGSCFSSLDCRIDLQSASTKANEGTGFQADVTQDGFAMILKNGECNGVGARSANFLRDEEKRHNRVNRLGCVFVDSVVQVVFFNSV